MLSRVFRLVSMPAKKTGSAKLTAEQIPGLPVTNVVHTVEPVLRSLEISSREWKFISKLERLAGLPRGLKKLDRIDRISERTGIYQLWSRARLSRLENEFLTLLIALISSPEKHWVPLVRQFLGGHGWQPDLRGRPKSDTQTLVASKRGPEIEAIIDRLRPGFELKKRAKLKGGYIGEADRIEAKLKINGYSEQEIKAIMKCHQADSAACYYYRMVTEPGTSYKVILNSYRRYQRMKITSASVTPCS